MGRGGDVRRGLLFLANLVLAGLLIGRNCGMFILSTLAGIVLAACVGRQNFFSGMMPGILALMAVGGHAGALTNGWFRRELVRSGLPH